MHLSGCKIASIELSLGLSISDHNKIYFKPIQYFTLVLREEIGESGLVG